MNAIVKGPLQGEVFGPRDTVTVIAALHPLKSAHQVMELAAGVSVAEIIDAAAERFGMSRLARSAHVEIDGHAIYPEHWHRVRVKGGAHVVVRAVPGKGIGNIFKSILMIALGIAAAFIVGPAGLGIASLVGGGLIGNAAAGLVAGGIMMAGGLLLNALFPPTTTKSDDTTQSYSIAAQKNAASKWGPIPVMLGNARVQPKYAASPYTEFDGDDQYLRMLFVWGYGPVKLSDIRIGNTAIDHYDDVEVQTFEGYPTDGQQTLYPAEVVQDDLSLDITVEGGPFVQTAAEDAVEIAIDLVAPQGIVDVNLSNGKKSSHTWTATVDLLVQGTQTVVASQAVEITAKSNDPIRRTIRFPGLTPGAARDVRITKTSDDHDSGETGIYDTVTWSAVRSIRTSPPIEFSKPLAVTAIRIRATKQLNGTIDNLNAICSTIAKSWDGTQWVDGQETRNPADLFRLVLQGPANARAQPDVRLDLPTIEAWADVCRAKGYAFDMYRDFTASVRDTLRDICAAGRAVPTFRDGQWSVAWEDEFAPIVQHFTPRNARGFTWSQTYRVFPQGLRCKFVNRTKDFVEDEILVFDAGYDKTSATLYEQAEFPGVTDPQAIVDAARYRIADAKQRPATYKLTVDFEHLIAQRSDRVAVAYDVIAAGLASGRVKAVDGNQVTLDEPAVMEAGKAYGIRFRYGDGTSNVCGVTTIAGTQTIVTITSGTAPAVGNLYTFGLSGQETGVFRVLAIKPDDSGDLSAEITLVDDAPDVQAGDGGAVPGSSPTAPEDLSKYRPRNLRATQSVELRTAASVHVTKVFWDAIFGANYASFEAIATDDSGNSIRQTVDASTQVAEFDDLPDGVWSVIVRALIVGGKFTPASDPLLIEINVPVGTVGVGSANIIDQSVIAQKLADAAVTARAIADETIGATKFAAAIRPVELLADLPADGNTEGRQVYNTTDGKLYRYHDGAWTSAISAADLPDGAVTQSKIADAAVSAAKLADQAVTLTKFASGLQPIELVSVLPATGNAEGRQVYNTADGKLYRYHAGAWTATVAAGDVAGQITATQISDGAISTPKLAAGAVTADVLAANAVTAGKVMAGAIGTAALAAGAVTTGILAAGAVTAGKIASKTITTAQMIVTQTANCIPNANFGTGDLSNWSRPIGDVSVISRNDATGSRRVCRFGPNAAGSEVSLCTHAVDILDVPTTSDGIPVVAGEKYRIRIDAAGDVGGVTGDFVVELFYFNAATGAVSGVGIWSIYSSQITATNTTYDCGVWTVPAGAVNAELRVRSGNQTAGAWYWTNLSVVRMASGELIVDGAVKAASIAAGAITGDKIAANAITSGLIAAGAVTATQIAAGAITTDKLAAGAVSANQLAVGNAANLLPNADFKAGLTDWTSGNFHSEGGTGDFSTVAGVQLNPYQQGTVPGEASIDMWQANADGDKATLLTNGKRLAAVPGQRYQFSGYFAELNIDRNGMFLVQLQFFDAAGTELPGGSVAKNNGDIGGGNSGLSDFTRVGGFITAPGTARTMAWRVLRYGGYAANSHLWVARPMVAEALPYQTDLSPWSTGVQTLIQGGYIATGAITADKIAVNNLRAISASLGAVDISSAIVGSMQIATANIGDLNVTRLKIANNAVTTTASVIDGGPAQDPEHHAAGTASPFTWTFPVTAAAYVEIDITLKVTASTTGGGVKLYQNGVLIYSFALIGSTIGTSANMNVRGNYSSNQTFQVTVDDNDDYQNTAVYLTAYAKAFYK
ncbi:MAG: host specificity factor TipJ family phage tail protein [Pararhizobium sp.]